MDLSRVLSMLHSMAGRPSRRTVLKATAAAGASVAIRNLPTAAIQVESGATDILPHVRRTSWNPGLNAIGGIPYRTNVWTTLQPTGDDDTAAIQEALDSCPADQVVLLGEGDFHISGEGLAITRSNITMRGGGAGTRLVKAPGSQYPVIIAGTRWYKYTQAVNLAADGPKGSMTISLVSQPDLDVGEIVTIDQLTDPDLTLWSPTRSPKDDESRGWFGRYDRPIGQVMEVDKVNGTDVTFTTPLHIDFSVSRQAQLVRFSRNPDDVMVPSVRFSGIEGLCVSGGEGGDGGGNIHFFATAYCWIRNVESELSEGASVNLDGCFRCELRDSFLHSTINPNPGGGGYGIVLNQYAADNLVENTISWNFNKVMVMRTSGGGNVIGYNYMEDGWGAGYPGFPEVGLNASHMTTPHHELFEGNQSWNFDSDTTWGNSIYITVFRNHLTGKRRSIPPLELSDDVNRRAIGLTVGHRWYSFLGNVLGTADQDPAPAAGFVYEQTSDFGQNDPVPMWKLGYDSELWLPDPDETVVETAIRHGNFDYVTKGVVWDPELPQELPASLYLTTKPAFFGELAWPWVTPEDSTSLLATLPARARFDAIPHTASDASATPESTAGQGTAVTRSPECDEVVAWANESQTRFDELAVLLGPVANADATTLAIADPDTLREAVAALRDAAVGQTGSNPPPMATAVNDALVELFNDLANNLDALADAIDTGDQAAIAAAATSVTEVNAALANFETSPAFVELVQACPTLGRD
jgi:hypothetical protein